MRPILFASVAIAVLAVAAPSLMSRYLGKPVGRGVPEQAENSDMAPAEQGRRVAIEAARDGHFYVDAEINRRPIRLMVDTGATAVALRTSDAVAAGIRARPADFSVPVATANGTAVAAPTQLDSVAIADIEVAGVRALILPDDQLSVSLLGGSFLGRLQRYQVENGTLLIEN